MGLRFNPQFLILHHSFENVCIPAMCQVLLVKKTEVVPIFIGGDVEEIATYHV